ncbi:MAG: hypothetical protein IPL22_18090 [Bacteroidetes bacterium]|nr:hypothetical protein [Bacteroidota bacterium]
MRHLIYSKSMLAAMMLVGSVYSSIAQVLIPDTLLLKQHITILSDDKMEGRETGTAGEKMAYEYLSAEFRKVGLLPKGSGLHSTISI